MADIQAAQAEADQVEADQVAEWVAETDWVVFDRVDQVETDRVVFDRVDRIADNQISVVVIVDRVEHYKFSRSDKSIFQYWLIYKTNAD